MVHISLDQFVLLKPMVFLGIRGIPPFFCSPLTGAPLTSPTFWSSRSPDLLIWPPPRPSARSFPCKTHLKASRRWWTNWKADDLEQHFIKWGKTKIRGQVIYTAPIPTETRPFQSLYVLRRSNLRAVFQRVETSAPIIFGHKHLILFVSTQYTILTSN